MWPYMSLLSSSIHIVAYVVIADSRVNSYTSCNSLHPFINAHLFIPTLSRVATWESCGNIYTYCGLCGHTPTRVGHMGSTIWAVRMQRYDMAFRCHTYCGPCCHIQYAHVNINTHCGSCDHPRVLLNYPYLLWPMWPYSHESGPNGLDHMDYLNVMVWYIATTHDMAIHESALSLYTHCSPCGHRRLDGHMGHNRSI